MKKIIAILISVFVILGIFLFFIDFMAVENSYYHNFHEKYQISESSGLEKEWIEDASNGLVKFLKNGETSEIDNFFNEKEITHMKDVYTLFKLDRFVYKTLLVFSIFITLVYILIGKSDIILYIRKYFLKVYFGIVVFFAVLAGTFSSSFVYFHEIFFTNDLWILDYETDLMIRILPEEFFLNMFVNVIVLFSISVFVIYTLLRTVKFKNKNEF